MKPDGRYYDWQKMSPVTIRHIMAENKKVLKRHALTKHAEEGKADIGLLQYLSAKQNSVERKHFHDPSDPVQSIASTPASDRRGVTTSFNNSQAAMLKNIGASFGRSGRKLKIPAAINSVVRGNSFFSMNSPGAGTGSPKNNVPYNLVTMPSEVGDSPRGVGNNDGHFHTQRKSNQTSNATPFTPPRIPPSPLALKMKKGMLNQIKKENMVDEAADALLLVEKEFIEAENAQEKKWKDKMTLHEML